MANSKVPRNVIVSYAAIDRANELQASLPSVLPSFVKPMLPSHVTAGFWLGLSKKFCDQYLPKHDQTFVLLDEEKQEFNAKFLVHKTGFSGGWRGFSISHKLLQGDALVFQLIDHWKFRVYIVRVNGVNEIDGAIPRGINVCPQRAIDMDVQHVEEKGLVVFDPQGLELMDVRGMDDFSIIVDDRVIDAEIPKHFKIIYYGLCDSQKTYLHQNLVKGLNVKLATGIILETIRISDAIRGCKVTVSRAEFETWDKTLKAFEEIGMKVGFLRARISKLVGILFKSNELLEAKRKAKEDMRVINKKVCGLKGVIKNLDLEIQALKLSGPKLKLAFNKELNAPW